ncbi:MAG: monosaccharide transporter rane protein family [Chloroflexi bacterium]|nr:monosaccharide transporter rane protein family [Chloroflexota bacterium]
MASPSIPAQESRRSFRQWVRQLAPTHRAIALAYIADIALFIIGGLHTSSFLQFSNITSLLLLSSFVGIAAAGQTFVILIGGIDLSIPWVLNSLAILLTTRSLGLDSNTWWAVPLVLAAGLAIGTINALGIVIFDVPPVVMTLGMNGIMQGATLGLTSGFTCPQCNSYAPPAVQSAFTGNLFPSVPNGLLVWGAIIVVVGVVLSFSTLGRRIYALGNNRMAAYLAGVNTRRVTIIVYALSGMFAAITGIALAAFGQQATLGMGDPYLFASISAVVIGGASILGGRGLYWGTVAGAIFITVLPAILLQYQPPNPEAVRKIASGIVILVALLLYGREARET